MSDAQIADPPIHLLTTKEVGQMLRLSKRQVVRLNSCGKIPMPVRIGGAVRWFAQELSAWLAAGAPDRKIWESRKGLDMVFTEGVTKTSSPAGESTTGESIDRCQDRPRPRSATRHGHR